MRKFIGKIDLKVSDEGCKKSSVRFVLGCVVGILPTLAMLHSLGGEWGYLMSIKLFSGSALGGLVCVFLGGEKLKDIFYYGVSAPFIVIAAVKGSQSTYNEGFEKGSGQKDQEVLEELVIKLESLKKQIDH